MRNKLNLILLILLIPILINCSGVKEALEGQKRSNQSDEFLVKKKNPLQMPPDINKLPQPGDGQKMKDTSKENDVKKLLQIKETNNTDTIKSGSGLLSNMKKKIQ
tara:strand:+ start:65 stop:379 length:315 start_codon:yes stop_codon:yes gene_type:complete